MTSPARAWPSSARRPRERPNPTSIAASTSSGSSCWPPRSRKISPNQRSRKRRQSLQKGRRGTLRKPGRAKKPRRNRWPQCAGRWPWSFRTATSTTSPSSQPSIWERAGLSIWRPPSTSAPPSLTGVRGGQGPGERAQRAGQGALPEVRRQALCQPPVQSVHRQGRSEDPPRDSSDLQGRHQGSELSQANRRPDHA